MKRFILALVLSAFTTPASAHSITVLEGNTVPEAILLLMFKVQGYDHTYTTTQRYPS